MKNHVVLKVRDTKAVRDLVIVLAVFAVMIVGLTAMSNPGGLQIAVCTVIAVLCGGAITGLLRQPDWEVTITPEGIEAEEMRYGAERHKKWSDYKFAYRFRGNMAERHLLLSPVELSRKEALKIYHQCIITGKCTYRKCLCASMPLEMRDDVLGMARDAGLTVVEQAVHTWF